MNIPRSWTWLAAFLVGLALGGLLWGRSTRTVTWVCVKHPGPSIVCQKEKGR